MQEHQERAAVRAVENCQIALGRGPPQVQPIGLEADVGRGKLPCQFRPSAVHVHHRAARARARAANRSGSTANGFK